MATFNFDKFNSNADALASAYQNVQSQRAQIAQYAIQKAAGYLQNNKNDEALKEFRKALAFDPQNATAHTYIGKIYQGQGKLNEAINEFKSVVQNNSTSVTARNDLGNAYLQAKQYANAEKEFKTAARMDPINPLADYTLGIMYSQTDRLSEAETQFKKVAKVSPRDGNVFYALGSLYNKTGRTDEAIKNLEKALTLKKDFPSANFELGSAYANAGNTDKAQAQLSILQTKDTTLANDLRFVLEKPKMVYMAAENHKSFNQLLGARTPLWMLDPSLMVANASKKITVAIQFSNTMDSASITNTSNWEISRAKSTEGGYYNNSMPTSANEVNIPKRPFSVTYNPTTGQANVTFSVTQSSTIDISNGDKGLSIDPSHLVFKFSGKDASGRQMDTTGDQIDGYSLAAF
jgi:tetratricopeptide (TPR) repeat protein